MALVHDDEVDANRDEALASVGVGVAREEAGVAIEDQRDELLRAALGTRCIQTVVKRGYRLAVST